MTSCDLYTLLADNAAEGYTAQRHGRCESLSAFARPVALWRRPYDHSCGA
jgi:hypothetical protein